MLGRSYKPTSSDDGVVEMLQDPPPTQYDAYFRCFGFPVRVSVWFWVAVLVLGYSRARSWDIALAEASPRMVPILLMWGLCLLTTILIHELGHSLMMRRFATDSRIVLYHFGGLAIPTGRIVGQHAGFYGTDGGTITPLKQIQISLAGPFLQMGVAIIIMWVIRSFGYGLKLGINGVEYSMNFGPLNVIPGLTDGAPITSPGLFMILNFFLVPSLLWGLFNLVPVLPLDGGRVMSSLLTLYRQPASHAYRISMVTAGVIALYAFSQQRQMIAIMFLMFAFSSYQMLQPTMGQRY